MLGLMVTFTKRLIESWPFKIRSFLFNRLSPLILMVNGEVLPPANFISVILTALLFLLAIFIFFVTDPTEVKMVSNKISGLEILSLAFGSVVICSPFRQADTMKITNNIRPILKRINQTYKNVRGVTTMLKNNSCLY
ncbi:hypothetical protein D3C85_1163800 [compost metagenome]